MNEQLILIAIAALLLVGLAVFVLVRTLQHSGGDGAAPNSSAPLELLRIELDPESNQLRVRLAERPIEQVADIADERLRVEVQNLLKLLTPEKIETEPAVEPSNQPEPVSEVSPELPLPDDDLSAPLLTRLLDSLRRQRNYPSITPKTPAKASKIDAKLEEEQRAANVFVQVNAILQDKLRAQPDMPSAEVVGESGELHIRMGGQTYSQIDAVPDERVRELIRAAVVEWEAKQL